MSGHRKDGARRTGAGYTIPAAADELGISYKTLLAAVDRGQVQVIEFGGLRRVPSAEVSRLKTMLVGEAEEPVPTPRAEVVGDDDPWEGLSPRAWRLLTQICGQERGPFDPSRVASFSMADLLSRPGVGRRSVNEIQEWLIERGERLLPVSTMAHLTPPIQPTSQPDAKALGPDLIWGAEDIAREIGRSVRATFHLLSCGELPARRVGGKWVVSRARLQAFFNQPEGPPHEQ